MLAFQLVLKDLKKNKSFAVMYTMTLFLGILGFILIHSVKLTIEHQIKSRSKELLSSDMVVSTRRIFTEEEKSIPLKFLEEKKIPFKKQESNELYTMARSKQLTKLVDMQTVPEGYPFYGYLKLKNGPYHFSQWKGETILVSKELLQSMHVSIGDKVFLGEQEFTIADVVIEDTSDTAFGLALGPRVYIKPGDLAKTKLIRPGSTVRSIHYYKFPENIKLDLKILSKELKKKFSDPGIVVRGHEEASNQMANLNSQITDYLGLVAIVSLLLAALGGQFLFQTYVRKRFASAAILRTLGFNANQVIGQFILILVWLSFISGILGLATNALLFPSLISLFGKSGIAVPRLSEFFSFNLVAIVLIFTPLLSLVLSLPLLRTIINLPIRTLFNGIESLGRRKTKWMEVLWWSPSFVLFYLLTLYQTHSFQVGSLFYGLLLAALLVIMALVRGFFYLGKKFSGRLPLLLRLSFTFLERNPVSTLTSFLALALGTLLMTLIPTLEKTIQSEIQNPKNLTVPNLFLFDIQPEQLPPLEELLKNKSKVLSFVSPLVRGRLVKVNGVDFIDSQNKDEMFKTREDEQSERMKNRVLNLSFRDQLDESEKIVDGEKFSGIYDWNSNRPAEVSLEKKFAESMGIKLNDELEFDIQDLMVKAKVVSLRKVRWTSFRPNFFILFQAGVLDDAPKSYLAGIKELAENESADLQFSLSNAFSNISVIDVKDTIKKVEQMIEQVSLGLRLMATLCLMVGFLVIYCLGQSLMLERLKSLNLLKVLGLSLNQILGMILTEFMLIIFLASVAGSFLSLIIANILSMVMFDRLIVVDLLSPVLLIILMTLVGGVVAFLSTWRLLSMKPIILLREGVSQV